MAKLTAITWAIVLGSALVLTGVASLIGATSAPSPVTTETPTSSGPSAGPGDISTMNTEPWPAVTDCSRMGCPGNDTANVTIVLAARWGYLNDPALAGLEGMWHFNDTGTSGTFTGLWHLVFGRMGGTVRGDFTLPADGNGTFRGQWATYGASYGGSLWGAWIRANATSGHFSGKWNLTGRPIGGAVAGRWSQPVADGGGFRGVAIAAPSLAPVDWDGSLHTTEGIVRILRTVRFEPDDHILRQTDPQTVEWVSTTTVNWDGIIGMIRFPKGTAGPNVTLSTAQASFTWTARELNGLHVRKTVDSAGHEIEVFALVVQPPPPPTFARFQITMRWGNLSSSNGTDLPVGTPTTWDGFLQITYGGLMVERVLSFERGDYLLPPDNRVTVSWRSSTTTGWDGLLVGAGVPLPALNVTYVTLHAGSFTHVFTIAELVGDHVFDAGGGAKVEVHAVKL